MLAQICTVMVFFGSDVTVVVCFGSDLFYHALFNIFFMPFLFSYYLKNDPDQRGSVAESFEASVFDKDSLDKGKGNSSVQRVFISGVLSVRGIAKGLFGTMMNSPQVKSLVN